MGMPTETEREWRSGRYKGVAVPAPLQPVDDPAHSEGLRWFREGVDAALDSVQEPVWRRPQDGLVHTVPGSLPPFQVEQRRCPYRCRFGSHYWPAVIPGVGPEVFYCPGGIV